ALAGRGGLGGAAVRRAARQRCGDALGDQADTGSAAVVLAQHDAPVLGGAGVGGEARVGAAEGVNGLVGGAGDDDGGGGGGADALGGRGGTGSAAVALAQHGAPVLGGAGVGGEARVGAAEGVNGLVGVAGDDDGVGGGADDAHQQRGLRVEVLGVVDEQVAQAGAFVGEQVGVGGQGVQAGADEFGGVEGGRGGLGRLDADRPAQQQRLFVAAQEPARGHPLLAVVLVTEAFQVFGAEAAFGGAQHEVAQLLGEAVKAEGGVQA